MGGSANENALFVELENLELYRIQSLALIDPLKQVYTIMIHVICLLTSRIISTQHIFQPLLKLITSCYQAKRLAYKNYLSINFEESDNQTHLLT